MEFFEFQNFINHQVNVEQFSQQQQLTQQQELALAEQEFINKTQNQNNQSN